jgi:hypothetical protein
VIYITSSNAIGDPNSIATRVLFFGIAKSKSNSSAEQSRTARQNRFRNMTLYLCIQQDSWDKYSRRSAWRDRPAVRARCPLTDTNSQGELYTRNLTRTTDNSLSSTKFSPPNDQVMHKKATRKKSCSEDLPFRLFVDM